MPIPIKNLNTIKKLFGLFSIYYYFRNVHEHYKYNNNHYNKAFTAWWRFVVILSDIIYQAFHKSGRLFYIYSLCKLRS